MADTTTTTTPDPAAKPPAAASTAAAPPAATTPPQPGDANFTGPVSVGEEIHHKTDESARDSLAAKLKEQWKNLGILTQVPTPDSPAFEIPAAPPSDDQLRAMADDLIKNRKATFTLKDGSKRDMTIAEMDGRVAEIPAEYRAQILQGFDSVDQMIPTQKTLDDISAATTKGVEKESGFSFGKLFAAIIAWIGALFSGHPISFHEAMAQGAAGKVSDSVKNELDGLAATNPQAAQILAHQEGGYSTEDRIADTAKAGVYTHLGLKPPTSNIPPTTALADAQTLDPAMPNKAELHSKVARAVMGIDEQGNPLTNPDGTQVMPLADTIAYGMRDAIDKYTSTGHMLHKPKEQIEAAIDKFADAASPAVAETFTDVITGELKDAKGRKGNQLTKEEFTQLVTDKSMEKMAELSTASGLPPEAMAPAMASIRKAVEAKVDEQYGELVAVNVIAENAPGDAKDIKRLAGATAADITKATGTLQKETIAAITDTVQLHLENKVFGEINGKVSDAVSGGWTGYTGAGISDTLNSITFGLVGKRIPRAEDIDAASKTISASLTNTMTSPDFVKNFSGLDSKGQEDFIAKQLLADLNANKDQFKPLDGKIVTMAQEGAKTVVEEFHKTESQGTVLALNVLTSDANKNAALAEAARIAKNAGVSGGKDADTAQTQSLPLNKGADKGAGAST